NLLEQAGVIRADNLNDLFNTAKGFDNFNLHAGNKGAVVTNAGGPAIIAVDKLEQCGLKLCVFSEETRNALKQIVHPEGSINNPVDLLPGADAAAYKKVVEILLNDENVDFIVSIFVEPVMVKPFDVIEGINSIETNKTIIQTAMPLPEFWQKYNDESAYHTPIFKNLEDPAIVIRNLLSFKKSIEQKRLQKNISLNLTGGLANGFLDNDKIKELFNKYDLPLVKDLILSREEIHSTKLVFPLVIKAINKNIIHKSDLDCVRLNIRNKEELLKNINEIEESLFQKGYVPENYLVQPYIQTKHELLIGGFNDPCFGPVIMFGTGGKYVEYLNDTKMASAYLCDEDINNLIDKTHIGKIIKGVRGETSVDIVKLKDIIKGLAQMLLDNPNIKEFDSNPLIVDVNNNFYIVDVRIKIENNNEIN
ncbi:MAG: acetate--CoA ligase family protein, partial [Bacteroidota bacterium]|nr:acetate--CoA ligase family protein [Bacteroidota bacterium]